MCTLRFAMSDTADASNAAPMRPTGPDHDSAPGLLMVTVTLRLGFCLSSWAIFARRTHCHTVCRLVVRTVR